MKRLLNLPTSDADDNAFTITAHKVKKRSGDYLKVVWDEGFGPAEEWVALSKVASIVALPVKVWLK